MPNPAIYIGFVAVTLSTSAHADRASVFDQSTKPVGACSFSEMLAMTEGIPTVSAMDAAAICATMARSLGRLPQIDVLRAGLKSSSLISIQGGEWGVKTAQLDVANQLMKIVRLRGLSDPKRMIGTFDTAWKIFEGTTGAVTPSDLIDLLRTSGPAAHTLSDKGLISMATLVWEQKKSAGQ